jgi:hypothetical protein
LRGRNRVLREKGLVEDTAVLGGGESDEGEKREGEDGEGEEGDGHCDCVGCSLFLCAVMKRKRKRKRGRKKIC